MLRKSVANLLQENQSATPKEWTDKTVTEYIAKLNQNKQNISVTVMIPEEYYESAFAGPPGTWQPKATTIDASLISKQSNRDHAWLRDYVLVFTDKSSPTTVLHNLSTKEFAEVKNLAYVNTQKPAALFQPF